MFFHPSHSFFFSFLPGRDFFSATRPLTLGGGRVATRFSFTLVPKCCALTHMGFFQTPNAPGEYFPINERIGSSYRGSNPTRGGGGRSASGVWCYFESLQSPFSLSFCYIYIFFSSSKPDISSEVLFFGTGYFWQNMPRERKRERE